MANQSSGNDSDMWRLDATKAYLNTPLLTARVDLLNPYLGLHELVYEGSATSGFVLGVVIDEREPIAKKEISDLFVRGNDLVVTYAETADRPFSLQVYWSATVSEQGVLLLDTILALQTDLLESFPGLTVETQMPAATARLLPGDHTKTTELTVPAELPADQSGSLLLRPTDDDWSYAEASHPEDRGECQLERGKDKSILLHRQLGGSFLEKGVIRSLRVRGAFLPRENDLELATRSLASLATEEPPLTV